MLQIFSNSRDEEFFLKRLDCNKVLLSIHVHKYLMLLLLHCKFVPLVLNQKKNQSFWMKRVLHLQINFYWWWLNHDTKERFLFLSREEWLGVENLLIFRAWIRSWEFVRDSLSKKIDPSPVFLFNSWVLRPSSFNALDQLKSGVKLIPMHPRSFSVFKKFLLFRIWIRGLRGPYKTKFLKN